MASSRARWSGYRSRSCAEPDTGGYFEVYVKPLDPGGEPNLAAFLKLPQCRALVVGVGGCVTVLAAFCNLARVVQWLCALAVPLMAVAHLHYWLTLRYRRALTPVCLYLLFWSGLLGEVVGQVVAPDAGRQLVAGLRPVVTLAVYVAGVTAAALVTGLPARLAFAVVTVYSAGRLLSLVSLPNVPLTLRPFLGHTCVLGGVLAAKYTESLLTPRITTYVTQDGKILAVRRRRTSSSTGLYILPKTRRISLPLVGDKKSQNGQAGTNSTVDVALIAEAHGLVSDMLADSNLPPHITSGLRALSTLLSPPNHTTAHHRLRIGGASVSLADFHSGSDTEEIPYTGERPSVLPKRLRRNLPPNLLRRMSTSTWTTTTSATGMPTLEPEPSRKRSTSFRSLDQFPLSPSTALPSTGLNGKTKSPSTSPRREMLIATGSVYSGKSRSFSTTAIPSSSGPHRRNSRDRKTVCTLHPLTPADVLGLQSAHATAQRASGDGAAQEEQDGGETTEDESREGDSSQPLPPLPSFRRVNITSDYESSNDSPSGSDNNDTALGSEEPPGGARVLTPKHVGVQTGGAGFSLELGPCSLCGTCARLALGQKAPTTPPVEKVPSPVDPTPEPSTESLGNVIRANDVYYDLDQLANDPLLSRIAEWDYPIFDLQEQAKDLILSQICYRVFLEVGLFESFRIPMQEFLNYFHILETGYREKPYHNRMHAADVLHGVYVLTSQLVPGFTQISADSTDSPLHRSFECGSTSSTPVHRSSNVEDTYGVMGANFPALELMALYTAAAMHDYDHPGRTNAFLVSTNAPQAVLYNDRSVLENHHAAAAWSLFLSKPEYNWLQHLDKAEFKRFRYVIIECILATDLKRHFEILAEFNAKVNDDDATGIDWSQEVDRLLVMEMCIKLADINGPCKAHDIHVRWTYRIAEEFYEQGDEEASLGLPISPFMDRRKPQLAKLQESFINHLVAPLCNAYGEAGLLPGYWVDADSDDEATKDGEKQETTDTKSCDEDQPTAESAPRGDLSARRRSFRSIKARRVRCLPTQHLQSNYEHWIAILREDAKNKEMENGYVDYSGHEEEGTGSEADMETTPSEGPRNAAGEAC